MLRFGNGTYFARMWFMSLEDEGLDFLGALFLEKNAKRWKFVYRFRYDAVPEEGKEEERNWFEAKLRKRMTKAEALAELRQVIDPLTEAMNTERHELILDTANPNVIHAALSREAWCHISLEKEQEDAHESRHP